MVYCHIFPHREDPILSHRKQTIGHLLQDVTYSSNCKNLKESVKFSTRNAASPPPPPSDNSVLLANGYLRHLFQHLSLVYKGRHVWTW